jgi:hypothetical protein
VLKDEARRGQEFPELKLKRLNFKVDSLFICDLGESHSCQRIVRQVHF